MKTIIGRGPLRIYWRNSGYHWFRFGEGRNLPWFRHKMRGPYSGGAIIWMGRLIFITGKQH